MEMRGNSSAFTLLHDDGMDHVLFCGDKTCRGAAAHCFLNSRERVPNGTDTPDFLSSMYVTKK